MNALLPSEDDPELPSEDIKPEELPDPVRIRPEEILESLEIFPDLVPTIPTACRTSQNTSDWPKVIQDIVDVFAVHPHAAIAWSDESRFSWLRGHSTSSEAPTLDGIAMCSQESEPGETP